MDDLMKFFHARKTAYRTAARRFDEAIYTPYTYDLSASHTHTGQSSRDPINVSETVISQSNVPESGGATLPIDARSPEVKQRISRFQNQQPEGESDVFLFEYGVVVFCTVHCQTLSYFFSAFVDGRDVGDD